MIIGIDEVGRGCWAGPLVAAAVGFDNGAPAGLNDSKKLSEKKRDALNTEVRSATTHIGVGWVWPQEINEVGLTQAVRLAMQRALSRVMHSQNDQIIIDGNIDYLKLPNSKAVIRADGSITEASAASIIAKVARDGYMYELAKDYPNYGFDAHVGYGTKSHIKAMKIYGILGTVHRLTYKPVIRIMAGEY